MQAGSDLAHCPAALNEEQVDLGTRPIPPLSCANECAVLAALAALCGAQLRRYASSLGEDLAELAAVHPATGLPLAPPFSNRRNALVLLAGEKCTAHFYEHLAEVAVPLLREGDARSGLRGAEALVASCGAGLEGYGRASRDRDTARYVKGVVLPLLQRRAALEAAAAVAAAAAAAAASAAAEGGVEGAGAAGAAQAPSAEAEGGQAEQDV